MKQFIFCSVLLFCPAFAYAAAGDKFAYGSGHYEILSESELTVAFLGFDNADDSFFYPSVEWHGKKYVVTEIQKKPGNQYYFNCDFTNFPPADYKVKIIGDYVFQFTDMHPNDLPRSVEHIGASNFSYRQDIESVVLPASLKSLGTGCFSMCQKLTSVTFPHTLETIGLDCFLSCNLKEAVISSCKEIKAGAFQDNPNLSNLSLPSNLEYIGSQAFNSCRSLTQVVMPASLSRIEDRVFRNCNALKYVIFTSGNQPELVKPDETEISIEDVYDNIAAQVETFVTSRKTYSFGKELISFKDIDYVYNGKAPELSWVNNTPWTVSLIVANVASGVGEHTQTFDATFTELSGLSINIPFTYTIKKAPLRLWIDDVSRVYGDFSCKYNCAYEGFVNNETESSAHVSPSYVCEVTYKSPVGTYPITADVTCPNYEVEIMPGTCTVTKAPLKVRVSNTSRTYGEANPAFSSTFEGLKSWETTYQLSKPIEYTTDATIDSSVGEYQIIASGGEMENYYFESYTNGRLTVNKATLSVTPKNVERVYGDPNPDFEAAFDGFKLGETSVELTQPLRFSTSAKETSDVGYYTVSVSGAESRNYKFTYKPGSLTINKAPLTVKVSDVTRQYGDANPKWTIEYRGLKNGETTVAPLREVSVYTDGCLEAGVGTYEIVAEGGSFYNYEITEYINGTLTVNKAPLDFKVMDVTRLYGDENPEFEVDFIGVKDVDVRVGGVMIDFLSPFTISCEAGRRSPCGDYDIEVEGGEARNYYINDRSAGVLHIAKRELSVYPEDAERPYGRENPEFKLVFNGFVNGDSEKDIAELPVVRTDATKESLPGEYLLTLVGGESDNYDFQFGIGIMKIKKNTLRFSSLKYEFTYDGKVHLPEYVCDGEITDERFRELLTIKYRTWMENLNSWVYLEVDEIINAGDYKVELHGDDETLNSVDFADVTVNLAESHLTIVNRHELLNMKVGSEVFIEWESDAPHTSLYGYINSAPVDYGQVIDYVDGKERVRYRVIASRAGSGVMEFGASGSPNHKMAFVEVPISVIDESEINNVSADRLKIISEPLKIKIYGKSASDKVYVYNISGQPVYSGTESEIEVTQHGVYILLINGTSYKVKL